MLYTVGVILIIANTTNLIYNDVEKYFWGYYPTAGKLYWLCLVMFICLLLISILLLYKQMLKAKKEKKFLFFEQLRYVFIAISIGITGVIDYIIKYKIEIYPWGYISSLLSLTFMAYAIIKYHLMDINVAIKKTTLLGLRAGMPAGVYVFLVTTFQNNIKKIHKRYY